MALCSNINVHQANLVAEQSEDGRKTRAERQYSATAAGRVMPLLAMSRAQLRSQQQCHKLEEYAEVPRTTTMLTFPWFDDELSSHFNSLLARQGRMSTGWHAAQALPAAPRPSCRCLP